MIQVCIAALIVVLAALGTGMWGYWALGGSFSGERRDLVVLSGTCWLASFGLVLAMVLGGPFPQFGFVAGVWFAALILAIIAAFITIQAGTATKDYDNDGWLVVGATRSPTKPVERSSAGWFGSAVASLATFCAVIGVLGLGAGMVNTPELSPRTEKYAELMWQLQITSLIALALCVVGWFATEYGGNARRRLKLAFSLSVVTLLAGVLVPAMARVREATRLRTCYMSLREICIACHEYAEQNGNQFPPNLATLVSLGKLSRSQLICPCTRDDADPNGSYEYFGDRISRRNQHAILAIDKPGNHKGGHVLYVSGVEFVSPSRLEMCRSEAVRMQSLVNRMAAGNATDRVSAAQALPDGGPIAEKAIPELAKMLTDHNPKARQAALEAFARIKPDDNEIIRKIVNALTDKNDGVRSASLDALRMIKPNAEETVSAIFKVLEDQRPDVRHVGTAALAAFGANGVPAILCELADNQNPDVQAAAINALAATGSGAKDAIPMLLDALTQGDIQVRRSAILTMEKIGPDAKVAIPALVALLKDDDKETCRAAYCALVAIGPEAIPAFIRVLNDSGTQDAREAAIYALARIGSKREDVVHAIVHAVEDDNAVVRRAAVNAMERLTLCGDDAARVLVKALQDSDPDVQIAAIGALDKFGPAPVDIVPEIVDVLTDDRFDQNLIRAAGRVIEYNAEAAVPLFVKKLSHDNPSVRNRAILAMAYCGTMAHAQNAIPSLVEALEDIATRPTAFNTLLIIAPYNSGILPFLIEELNETDADRRIRAMNALAKFGPDAKAAVPVLVDRLRNGDSWERNAATRALRAIDPDALAEAERINGDP